jgi:hypothetical protein
VSERPDLLLALRGWSLTRETAAGPVTLLRDLDLTLRRGEWVARFWPTIRLGMLTSVVGFATLLFSGFPGLAQLELRPPRQHLEAVVDETLHQFLEVHLARAAVVNRQHDDAEGVLKLRVLVEVVDDHLRDGVALQLDDDPDAFLVGLVPQVGYALEGLVLDKGGYRLDQV